MRLEDPLLERIVTPLRVKRPKGSNHNDTIGTSPLHVVHGNSVLLGKGDPFEVGDSTTTMRPEIRGNTTDNDILAT